jgi:hypothetical protein
MSFKEISLSRILPLKSLIISHFHRKKGVAGAGFEPAAFRL